MPVKKEDVEAEIPRSLFEEGEVPDQIDSCPQTGQPQKEGIIDSVLNSKLVRKLRGKKDNWYSPSSNGQFFGTCLIKETDLGTIEIELEDSLLSEEEVTTPAISRYLISQEVSKGNHDENYLLGGGQYSATTHLPKLGQDTPDVVKEVTGWRPEKGIWARPMREDELGSVYQIIKDEMEDFKFNRDSRDKISFVMDVESGEEYLQARESLREHLKSELDGFYQQAKDNLRDEWKSYLKATEVMEQSKPYQLKAALTQESWEDSLRPGTLVNVRSD